jgi:Raf kinase inhibitor-like YbhB/YbcL family protein
MIAGFVLALATAALQLHSGDFVAGGVIPSALMSKDCAGQNQSPSLIWTGAPDATKSFALIMHDPDAPMTGGFYHWVLYNIPAGTNKIDGNAALPKTEVGSISTGKAAYYGPCPPKGPAHHYIFTLYALDIDDVGATSPLDAASLEKHIKGHVLAMATLEATASSP